MRGIHAEGAPLVSAFLAAFLGFRLRWEWR